MSLFTRRVRTQTVTIASGANLSDAIDFRSFAGGIVHMPAAWTAASIGFKVSSTMAGTYLPLFDDDDALVQIDSAAVDQAYQINDAVFASSYVKLWSQDGSEGDTNQAAARSLIVDLKS